MNKTSLPSMKHLSIALTAITALACTGGEAGAANKRSVCLNLDGSLFGKAEVLLSDAGIKIKNRPGLIYWFAEKPNFVYLVNPENQTYFAESTPEYVKNLRDELSTFPYTRIEHLPKALPDGMKAELIIAFLRNKKGQEVKVAEVRCLKNSGLPASVNHMWCTLMGVPEKDFSLPVGVYQCVRRNWNTQDAFDGRRQRWVPVANVKYVGRKTVDDKLLNLPDNYKAAKDKMSMYQSTDGELKEKYLEDFFRSDPKKK